jgi:hypothetical protein
VKALRHSSRTPFAAVLALLLIAASAAHGADCYILSAGVDNYQHAQKLSGDVNDARNATAAFKAQEGKLFGKVFAHTLVDGQATRGAIVQRLQSYSKTGKAGDYVVVFLSGHGGVFNDSRAWYFLPYDFNPQNANGTCITDRVLLDAADGLVKQGRKVVIVIDACFSGQLANAAQPYLKKYQDAKGGGLIVMVSSSAGQMSNALGQYSAFAKAFADSMAGAADLNHDGKVTLEEIRQFSFKRTYELLKQAGNNAKQDSAVAWSPNFKGNTPLAMVKKSSTVPTNGPSLARQWTGSENLSGFGRLSFTLNGGGQAVMVDAHQSWEGTWHQSGDTITLRFDNGRVVYTGTLSGTNLSGSATNGRTSWTWNVRAQSSATSIVMN